VNNGVVDLGIEGFAERVNARQPFLAKGIKESTSNLRNSVRRVTS